MKTRWSAAIVLLGITLPGGQEPVPPALQAMAESERAFAKAATLKGVRDAFLEFFADDSIAFTPAPAGAKERLRARPAQPFSVQELTWEPRTGDVAASGELGWLTGPSTFVNRAAKDAKPQHGNYLSVWRRQADGTWKVFIDVGTSLPEPATFQPGFTRYAAASRYTGKTDKATAATSLIEADRALNADLPAAGAGKAYGSRLTPASRLHRNSFIPTIGATAIVDWLSANLTGMTASTTAVEASLAGDLGYSYGLYDVKAAKPEAGAYLRIWTREASGKWLVAVDVTQPR